MEIMGNFHFNPEIPINIKRTPRSQNDPKLMVYKLLTQLIIILGLLRGKVSHRRIIRTDRTFFNELSMLEAPSWGIINECCDCGAGHRIWLRAQGLYQQPERPEGYDYSWRRFGSPASGFLPVDMEVPT